MHTRMSLAPHRAARLFTAILFAATIGTSVTRAAEKADYVFTHGAIYTMEKGQPTAQAIAIKGKQISYVGSDQGVQAYVGDRTQVTDLKGRMLLPGFVDAHTHPTTAFLAQGADLQFDSLDQILASLKAWADAHPDAKVIRGFGWRYNVFPKTGPHKADLDRVISDRPVLLAAIDGHSAWVNSKALELAGVNAKHPDPVPGFSYYQRDPKTAEPTGWAVETPAAQEMLGKLAPPTPEAVIAAMTDILPKFAAAGITAVFDAGMPLMPTDRGFAAYQELEKANKLPLRIVGCYYWNNPKAEDPAGIALRLRDEFHSELVQARALKINVDGGDFQRTTVLIKSYPDQPGYHGEFLLGPELINAAVLKAQARGLDTHAHVVGDGAVRAYLDAVEAARKAYPNSVSRHTAAHATYLTDDEVARMASLNVTCQASAQWNNPDPGVEVSVTNIGKEIMFTEMGRLNSVLIAGGRVAFGADWPAANYTSTFLPLDAIQVSLTRAILPQYGQKQFLPVLPPANERITLDQALKAQTVDAAYVLGLDDRIGSLKTGKLADLVVLEKDLHQIPASAISTTKVTLTMMNGRITHRGGY